MTLFGILWIILILYCFLNNNIKYILSLTLFSMILQCTSIFHINNLSIGPQVITCLSFVIYCLLRYKIYKKININSSIVLLILLFISIIISLLFNNISITYILKSLQFFIYILSFICILNISDINNDYVYKTIKFITVFVLIIGALQFITTSGIINRIGIISKLFYNDNNSSIYYWHSGYDRICSTFMEASYCGCFLVGSFYYFLSIYNKKNKNIFILIALLIETLLTFSSTAYIALVICGIIFLITSKNIKLKRILIFTSLVLLSLLLLLKFDVIKNAILTKTLSGSFYTRKSWNTNAMNAFNNSPLFGVGYNSLRGSSIVCSLLGQIGLIGTFFYLLFNINVFFELINIKKNKSIYLSSIGYSIISIIIAQLIACPDLEFCVYWYFIYILGLYSIKEVIHEKA